MWEEWPQRGQLRRWGEAQPTQGPACSEAPQAPNRLLVAFWPVRWYVIGHAGVHTGNSGPMLRASWNSRSDTSFELRAQEDDLRLAIHKPPASPDRSPM